MGSAKCKDNKCICQLFYATNKSKSIYLDKFVRRNKEYATNECDYDCADQCASEMANNPSFRNKFL